MHLSAIVVALAGVSFASPFHDEYSSDQPVSHDKRSCDVKRVYGKPASCSNSNHNKPPTYGGNNGGNGGGYNNFDLSRLLKNMTLPNFLPIRLTPIHGSKDIFGPPPPPLDLSNKEWYHKLFPSCPQVTVSCPASSGNQPTTVVQPGTSNNSTNVTQVVQPGTQVVQPGTQVVQPGTQVVQPGTSTNGTNTTQVIQPGTQVVQPGTQVVQPGTSAGGGDATNSTTNTTTTTTTTTNATSEAETLRSANLAAAAANLTTTPGYIQSCNVGAPQNPIYALNDTTRVVFRTSSANVALANTTNLDYSATILKAVNRTDFVALLDTLQAAVDAGVRPSSKGGFLSYTNGSVEAQFISTGTSSADADSAFPGVVAVWQWLRCDGGANEVRGAVSVIGKVGIGSLLANIGSA